MGFLDSINKTLSSVEKTYSTADRAKRVGKKVKGTGEAIDKAFKKKCKFCEKPLESDLEQKKGVCTNCALERM